MPITRQPYRFCMSAANPSDAPSMACSNTVIEILCRGHYILCQNLRIGESRAWLIHWPAKTVIYNSYQELFFITVSSSGDPPSGIARS
jgi:hypothetical protein